MNVKQTGLLAAILLAVGSFLLACGGNTQSLPANGIVIDGVDRQYNLFVPNNPPDTPMPLLIAFHGGGGIGEAYDQQSDYEALAQAEGFIMAFPQGYAHPGNEGEWQLNTRPDARHDIDFINAMIDEIAENHSIDASRIYATGYSLGSMFIYEVACQMSGRIAAVASYAGTMPVNPANCNPERFAPIMHIHGSDDGIIPYADTWDWKAWDEVGEMRDVPSLIEYWRTKYNCQNSSETNSNTDTHFVHDMCDQGARVEHHRVEGLDHEWPERINGVPPHLVIWNFVSGFTL